MAQLGQNTERSQEQDSQRPGRQTPDLGDLFPGRRTRRAQDYQTMTRALLDLVQANGEKYEGWRGKIAEQNLAPGDNAAAIFRNTADGSLHYVPMSVSAVVPFPLNKNIVGFNFSVPKVNEAALKTQLVESGVLSREDAEKLKPFDLNSDAGKRAHAFLERMAAAIDPLEPLAMHKIEASRKPAELTVPETFTWSEQMKPFTGKTDQNAVLIVNHTPEGADKPVQYFLRTSITARQQSERIGVLSVPAEQQTLSTAETASLAKALGIEPGALKPLPEDLRNAAAAFVQTGTFGAAPGGGKLDAALLADQSALTSAGEPVVKPQPGEQKKPGNEPAEEPDLPALSKKDVAAQLSGAKVDEETTGAILVVKMNGAYYARPMEITGGGGTRFFAPRTGPAISDDERAALAEQLGVSEIHDLPRLQGGLSTTFFLKNDGRLQLGEAKNTYPVIAVKKRTN